MGPENLLTPLALLLYFLWNRRSSKREAAGAGSPSPAPESDSKDRAQAAADALLKESGAPGAVAAIYAGGEVYEAVAGERLAGSGVPAEVGDLWHVGSITKSMTATLAARLAAQGRIRWDDTVGSVLGETGAAIHPRLAPVTYRQLLSHRGGVRANPSRKTMIELSGLDGVRDPKADRALVARDLLARKPSARPGEKFLYTNAGYLIAAHMMETQIGASWEVAIREHVFEPLGLAEAGFGPPGSAETVDQPQGHGSRFPLPGVKAEPLGSPEADNPPFFGPAGRVHATAAEMLRYAAAHAAGARESEDANSFLPAEQWSLLHSAPDGLEKYAMGWGVDSDGLTHNGSNTLWFADLKLWPEADRAVFVAVNSGRLFRAQLAVEQAIRTLAPEGSSPRKEE
ncbi:MAG: serine hydrolase domain-containing protein [Acidobacteriota bacterium]